MFQFIREPLNRYDDSNDDDYDLELQDDETNNSRNFSNKSNRLKRNSGQNPPSTEKRTCLSELYNSDSSRLCFDEVLMATDQYPTEKLTRGKQKIPIQFIEDRTRRYSTFSKRKTGLMKKAFELAELTGAEVLLLVASETNHVYTFATHRLKNIIELDCGKDLIQSCLSSNKNGMMNESQKRNDTVINSETDSKYHDEISQVEIGENDEGQSVDGVNTNPEVPYENFSKSQSNDTIHEESTTPNRNLRTRTKSLTHTSYEITEPTAGDRCTQTEESSILPVVEPFPIPGNTTDPSLITTTVQSCKSSSNSPTPNPSQVILTGLFPPPPNVLLSTQMTTNQFLILSPPWNPIPVTMDNNVPSGQICSPTNSSSLGGVNLTNLLNINAGQSMKSYSLSIPLLNSAHIPNNTAQSSLIAIPTSIVTTTSTTSSLTKPSAFQECFE